MQVDLANGYVQRKFQNQNSGNGHYINRFEAKLTVLVQSYEQIGTTKKARIVEWISQVNTQNHR